LLVTGEAGYIGSVVTSQLLRAGHQVVVLDDLSTGHADAVPEGARRVQGRIQDAGNVLVGNNFDGVLHFAAKSLVEQSQRRPDLYWDNNVCGTLALLAAMRDAGVPRMVFSSSAATYGEPDVSPITEEVPAVPINPYRQSKLAVDYMLAGTCRAYGLAAAGLRYFNVGGALGRHGERHEPETHLIPNLLAVPAGRRPSVDVYGTDYPTPDGTAVRDYRPGRRAPCGAAGGAAWPARRCQPRHWCRVLRAGGAGCLPAGDRAPDSRRRTGPPPRGPANPGGLERPCA
jgi:UDP-glucose 4-epimerase